jgi:hypothetical protein
MSDDSKMALGTSRPDNSGDLISCDLTDEQKDQFKSRWASLARTRSDLMLEPVEDTPIKLAMLTVANIPSDATGLLIVKVGGARITEHHCAHFLSLLKAAVAEAGLRVVPIVITENSAHTFSLQLLTDDQLRAVGFQRVEPRPDYLGITRDTL